MVLRALARDLRRALRAQSSRATLRALQEQGATSLGLALDGVQHPPDVADFALFDAVERACGALAEPLRGSDGRS